MRVVVFTGNPNLDQTPWWPILLDTAGIDRVLICRKTFHTDARSVLKRFRKNVQKHGVLFIPYRVGLLAWHVARRPFRRHEPGVELAHTIPIEEIEAVDIHSPDVLEQVRAFQPDLGVSLGAPILRPPLFQIPKRGTINLHLGKVPDFRGAPPVFWEMMQGASSVGATVHWVDEGLDTGAVIAAGEAPIYSVDTLAEVEARAEELGTRVLRDALDAVWRGEPRGRPQPSGGKTNRFPTLRQRASLGWKLKSRRLRKRAAPRRTAKESAMAFALYVVRPLRDRIRKARRQHPVRVFTFHRITTLCRDGMTVSPAVFREQVEYVARHHDIVTLERGVELIRSGARLSRPAAVLTFDDAYRSVFTAARPVLADVGAPGCCFVSTALAGTDRRFAHDESNVVRPYLDVMSWAELETLKGEGWSFGPHTATHARLSECRGEQLVAEIEQPRRELQQRLQIDAAVLAYPFGRATDISDEALDVARRAGHTTVFSNFGGENSTGTQAFVLNRVDIGGDHDELAWKNAVHGIDLGRWRDLWPT
jgi:methionyl-tRNA formyltransferase/peptidoglycan/xylan/chitin deacetylase (PgdA/CDA1 family)